MAVTILPPCVCTNLMCDLMVYKVSGEKSENGHFYGISGFLKPHLSI